MPCCLFTIGKTPDSAGRHGLGLQFGLELPPVAFDPVGYVIFLARAETILRAGQAMLDVCDLLEKFEDQAVGIMKIRLQLDVGREVPVGDIGMAGVAWPRGILPHPLAM